MTTQLDPVDEAATFLKMKDNLNKAANRYISMKVPIDVIYYRIMNAPSRFLVRCAKECDLKASKLIEGFDYDKYSRFRLLIGAREDNPKTAKRAQAKIFNSFGDNK